MSTTTWNPTTHTDDDALKGFEVFTSDNDKLGTRGAVCHLPMEMTTARDNHYFRVEPGALKTPFTNAEEVFVPERLVRMVNLDDDAVILAVTKSDLEHTDWSRTVDDDTFTRYEPHHPPCAPGRG